MNVYTIPPFGGQNFDDNQSRLRANETPCAICGKAVEFPFRHEATVVNGGEWALTSEQAMDDDAPGFMGVFGIGPDCHRKYLLNQEALATSSGNIEAGDERLHVTGAS